MKKQLLSLFVISALLLSVLTTCKKEEPKKPHKDVPVTQVTLNKNAISLEVGEAETLIATVAPENATNITVSWTSSNLEVATVANGLVRGVEVGTATITVTTKDGNFTAKCEVTVNPVEVGVVINGIRWATRNLAAHGKFVKNPEDLGALFQWGRKGDGHEQRTSLTYFGNNPSYPIGIVTGEENFDTHGQIVSTHPAFGKFIRCYYKYGSTSHSSFLSPDWRLPSDDALWNSGSETAPVKTANDPCPNGWRLPTGNELLTLKSAGNWTDNPALGYFWGSGENILFLPTAGVRKYDGTIITFPQMPSLGGYWSSTVISDTWGWDDGPLWLDISAGVFIRSGHRGTGYSVRCVAE